MPESRTDREREHTERVLVAETLRRLFVPWEGSTHYEDCWRDHQTCAALYAARLLAPRPSTERQEPPK